MLARFPSSRASHRGPPRPPAVSEEAVASLLQFCPPPLLSLLHRNFSSCFSGSGRCAFSFSNIFNGRFLHSSFCLHMVFGGGRSKGDIFALGSPVRWSQM